MLKRGVVCLGLARSRCRRAPTHARRGRAGRLPRAIREPVRLTVGRLERADGRARTRRVGAVLVSDANGTRRDGARPVQTAPVPLSRGLGDASDPSSRRWKAHRVRLAGARCHGDACVRPVGEGKETCLTDGSTAELQVMWWDDTSLGVLSRRGLHGDYALIRVSLAGKKSETLLARNMVGLARSPDRAWLAYIPVDKATEDIGVTFSQRTGRGIALQKLGDARPPLSYAPRLPGVTGSVAFSVEGDFLYFAQFLNDTNKDAAVDGDDNAVIFSCPSARAMRSPRAEPSPSSSQRALDCHYPPRRAL